MGFLPKKAAARTALDQGDWFRSPSGNVYRLITHCRAFSIVEDLRSGEWRGTDWVWFERGITRLEDRS